jgi:hypothetical protein
MIFKSTNEYGDNICNVCSEFKYRNTEVCTTGFTGNLNLKSNLEESVNLECETGCTSEEDSE